MEYEFDKEIDALLRRTAAGETASADINSKSEIQNLKSTHLDADEISAFAENALPERLKSKYTAHFADCDRCRTILSNSIVLDAEAKIKTLSPVVAPEIAAAPTPWHRRLFAFPQMAYALGALVVLFGGFFAFLVVRESGNSLGSADVSQISERQPSAGGPSFDGESELLVPNELSNTMSNAMSSNTTSANTSSNMMMSNSASVSAPDATSVSTNSASRTANANSTVAQSPRASTLAPAPPPEIAQAAPPTQAETYSTDAAGNAAARVSESEKKTADRREDAEKTEAEQAVPRSDSSALSARNTTPTTGNDSDSPKTKARNRQSSGAESRQVGGKNFSRKEGVWYDANYKGQSTTNVSRGSDDYQKLDAGLRSIAGNLSGTVVIVWKNKAYRIQ